MEGFTAVLTIWGLSLWLAFMGGRYLPEQGLAKDCQVKEEIRISNTVYECKAIAVWNNGKRVILRN